MEANSTMITEEWICKKLNITHDNLDDIKTLSLPGTYHEKISHLGNSLFRFSRLKELDLSRNTLVSLEGLENLKLLEKLNLYYNNIGSLKDLERLKYNSALVELDLRLNPVTKEENDYRLFLINILPSLRVLDDRSIRESERQMANSLYHKLQAESRQNGKNALDNPVVSRVKSVSNIAKRSAGLTDEDDIELNQLSLKNYENDQRQRSQDFSTNLRDIIKGCNTTDSDFLKKTKSCSMLNLRSLNNDVPRLSKQKSVHFNEVDSYYDLNSYRSCSDNHFNMNDESEHYTNFKSRANFTPNPHYEDNSDTRKNDHDYTNEENKSQIYVLLDLVDRYWNGSKSLHKNQKFLSAAKQILNENGTDRFESNYQLKVLQEENRKLNYQLNQKKCEAESESYKGLISEIDNLKKKYLASQEELKNLRKELAEKSDKQKLKEDALSSMETQNSNMKRDIEIMKIKLKQYEQLQQLTTMLQESHKSLVSTNEHLLQEINIQKQFGKSGHNQSRTSYPNDMDIYGANYPVQDNLMQQILIGQDSKVLMRKQLEQMTNSNQGRYAYPSVK